jgi:hypothetical protein
MGHEAGKKIGEAFVRTLETNEPGDIFAEDVFCDINVPLWRFQLQGSAAIGEWLPNAQPDGSRVTSWDVEPTASGVVIEAEQRSGDHISRNLHRLEVRDGKITAWTMYCTGDWDAETQERHKREAPMIRP